MLEAKAGYIITTNRTPRDLVTSKEFFFFQTLLNFFNGNNVNYL